jgi:hypothetical protein
MAEVLGTELPSGLALVLGQVHDCARDTGRGTRSVANANARAFDEAGSLVPGVEVYYFQKGFPASRAVRRWTSADGLFLMTRLPGAAWIDVRAYGRIRAAETTLAARWVPSNADDVFLVDLDPVRE